MIVAYSLRGITRAGSKGMISARNIKAPHCCLYLQTYENLICSKLVCLKRKKNNPGSESNSFRRTKVRYFCGK